MSGMTKADLQERVEYLERRLKEVRDIESRQRDAISELKGMEREAQVELGRTKLDLDVSRRLLEEARTTAYLGVILAFSGKGLLTTEEAAKSVLSEAHKCMKEMSRGEVWVDV